MSKWGEVRDDYWENLDKYDWIEVTQVSDKQWHVIGYNMVPSPRYDKGVRKVSRSITHFETKDEATAWLGAALL